MRVAKKGDIVGAVDFGSRAVRVLVARQHTDGGIQVLGHGAAPGRGAVQMGVIQDIAAAQAALKKALGDAEKEAGIKTPALFCGVNGRNVDTFIREGTLKLDRDVVELHNLDEVLEKASSDIIAGGKQILSSVTSQEWFVDDIRVAEPIGIRGSVLKVRVHFAQLPALIANNIEACVVSQGRELEDIVFMPLAAGLGCLTPEDMDLGVAVLDIGRTTMGLVIYHDRKIVATHCFELGGVHITRDVAAGLQVSYDEADDLVIEYGISEALIRAMGNEDGERTSAEPSTAHIKLKSAVRGAPSIVERDHLDMIVFERAKELLVKVRQHLKTRGHMKNLVRGVVITGGSANIPNLPKLAEALFETPARRGTPEGIESMPPSVNNSDFAPVVGVVKHGFEYRAAARSGRIVVRRGLAGGVFRGIGAFFSKYFF